MGNRESIEEKAARLRAARASEFEARKAKAIAVFDAHCRESDQAKLAAGTNEMSIPKPRTADGRTFEMWTEADLAYLRAHHRETSDDVIAAAIGKTVKSVRSKAHVLGLKKSHERKQRMGRENMVFRGRPRPDSVLPSIEDRRPRVTGVQFVILEAAAWRARQLADLNLEGIAPRGCQAEYQRIRRAIRLLVKNRSQRARLLAITEATSSEAKDEGSCLHGTTVGQWCIVCQATAVSER